MAAADQKDLFPFKRPPRAVSFMRWLGGSLAYKAPCPNAEARAHANDQDITMVNVASVDHFDDMRARDKSE